MLKTWRRRPPFVSIALLLLVCAVVVVGARSNGAMTAASTKTSASTEQGASAEKAASTDKAASNEQSASTEAPASSEQSASTEASASIETDVAAEPSGVLAGRIGDLGDGSPIGRAVVRAGGRSATSGADGRYRLALPPGSYDVRVAREGYSAATVVDRVVGEGETRLDVGLPPNDPSPEAMSQASRALRAERLRWGDLAESGVESSALREESVATDAEGVYAAAGVVEVPETVRVLMPDDRIVEMEMDTYLKGVVPSEMGYVFRRSLEALKAQAIASRTYAATRCLPETAGDPKVCELGLDANVDTTTRTQVWRPVHYDVSDEAVDASRGQVVRAEGEIVHALFHARSHAKTLASEDSSCCGGRSWPYLLSVSSPDPFALSLGHQAGMSQEGAAVFADWGADAEEILRHYYANTAVDAPRPTPAAEQASEETVAASSIGAAADAGPAADESRPVPAVPSSSGAAAVDGETASSQARDVATGGPGEVLSGAASFEATDLKATGVVGLNETDDGNRDLLVTVESPVVEAEFPFGAVAARWQGDPGAVDGVEVELRASDDGDIWSDWYSLHADVAAVDAPTEEEPGVQWSELVFLRGRYVQLRASAPASADGPTALERVTLHYLNADDGPVAPEQRAAAQGPAVVSRASWGANESYRLDQEGEEIWPPEYHVPRAQIVHHTVTANAPADPAAVVRSIYYFHAVTRGWGDIGYNYLVDHRGNIYEGRYGGERGGRTVRGGHALQFNEDTIGVAVLGTFTDLSSQPATAAENALVELLAVTCAAHGIRPDRPVTIAGTSLAHSVLGHRDALPGHTACPGDGLHARMPSVRARILQRMGQLGTVAVPPPTRPAPSTATRAPTRPAPATATRAPTRPLPATATRAPTGRPSATVLPGDCIDVIDDGGFERLSTAWVRNRSYFTTWDVFGGAVSMFVGLRHDDTDDRTTYASVSQMVSVPPTVDRARMSFLARTSGYDGDRMVVRVLNENGAIIGLGQVRLPLESQWTQWSFDVSEEVASHGGERVRLYFAVINDGDGRKSYMRLDDVSLVVCEVSQGPASATATRGAPITPTRTPVRTATMTAGPVVTGTSSATPTRPPTRTPAPSQTSVPGRTPTTAPEPSGPTCTSVINDHGFDREGLPDWAVTGDHPSIRIKRAGPAGDGSLRLGPLAGEAFAFDYAAAAQAFTVTGEVVSATLSLRTYLLSAARDDAFVVELRSTSTGARRVLVGPRLVRVGAWTQASIPLDAAGLSGDMELFVGVLNRGLDAAGAGRTAVLVDEVDLQMCTRPAPRATHLPWAIGTRH